MKGIYEPSDDSYLLEEYVKKLASGIVLDMGTGSGIQAIAALKKAKQVYAADINHEVIKNLKKDHKEIKAYQSDLFSAFKNKKIKFDTIIFNPPYLPDDKTTDANLHGGKHGYETIVRFLKAVTVHLRPKGQILLLLSSFSNKPKVDESITINMLEHKELAQKHIFFEDLYVYLIRKSSDLKKIEAKGITKIKYFAKGKRGYVYTAEYKSQKIAVKVKNPGSEAVGRIENEAYFLRILNKKGIGPKILFYDKSYLCYKFVEGIHIIEFLQHAKKEDINKILIKVLQQMFTMDKLGINKEEMAHPVKHIIVKKSDAVLIDFERCRRTLKPSNVTQFCSFLVSGYLTGLLNHKGIRIDKEKIINLARQYKEKLDKESWNSIIKEIK